MENGTGHFNRSVGRNQQKEMRYGKSIISNSIDNLDRGYLKEKVVLTIKLKEMEENIFDQASYEAYLYDLLVVAINAKPTPTKSKGDFILEKALSYGCSYEDANKDVKRILNVHGAIQLLLHEASINIIGDKS